MKVLLDSNIIIYLASSDYEFLTEFLSENEIYVSGISIIEVLGYHKIDETDKQLFQDFFNNINILSVSMHKIEIATLLRQNRKMTLGDAIIAATTITEKLTLITRNIDDFKWIDTIKVINPYSS